MTITATPPQDIDLATLFGQGAGSVYTLRVRGDAFADEHLFDGDYVVVERRDAAKVGDLAVVLLDGGDVTLRKYAECDAGRVRGVVVGMLRTYQRAGGA